MSPSGFITKIFVEWTNQKREKIIWPGPRWHQKMLRLEKALREMPDRQLPLYLKEIGQVLLLDRAGRSEPV